MASFDNPSLQTHVHVLGVLLALPRRFWPKFAAAWEINADSQRGTHPKRPWWAWAAARCFARLPWRAAPPSRTVRAHCFLAQPVLCGIRSPCEPASQHPRYSVCFVLTPRGGRVCSQPARATPEEAVSLMRAAPGWSAIQTRATRRRAQATSATRDGSIVCGILTSTAT